VVNRRGHCAGLVAGNRLAGQPGDGAAAETTRQYKQRTHGSFVDADENAATRNWANDLEDYGSIQERDRLKRHR